MTVSHSAICVRERISHEYTTRNTTDSTISGQSVHFFHVFSPIFRLQWRVRCATAEHDSGHQCCIRSYTFHVVYERIQRYFSSRISLMTITTVI